MLINSDKCLADSKETQKYIYAVKLSELKIDRELESYIKDGYVCVKLSEDLLNKNFDIKLVTYRQDKNFEEHYLSVFQTKNKIFRYRVDNKIIAAKCYLLKNSTGVLLKQLQIDSKDSVYVNVYREQGSKIIPDFLVVRGYTRDNERCYASSMNITQLSEGDNKLYIRTSMPRNMSYVEGYLEYSTVKSTRVHEVAYDRLGNNVYVVATYYEPLLENILKDKSLIIKAQPVYYLYLELIGYDFSGNKIALSSRNMEFDLRKLLYTEGYAIDTNIINPNLPAGVLPERWEVKAFTSDQCKDFLDWALNPQTRDLFVVTTNFSSSNTKYLVIKGYNENHQKIYLSSRNMLIKRGTIDTAIIPNIDIDVKNIKVETVEDKANLAYIVDWCIGKEGNLYITAVNNTDNDVLYLLIKGYRKDSTDIFLTTRNMQIKRQTIDTAVISNVPTSLIVVAVKVIINKPNSSYFVDWQLDKKGNLYIVAVNNTSNNMQFALIKGYDGENNKIYLSSRNLRIRPNTIDTNIISNIPAFVKKVEVEMIPNKSLASFVVDWCLDKQRNLYVVGVNNSERDDNLWLLLQGYDQKDQKVWLGSRNFRVRKGTVDTCIVSNIPDYVKRVDVSLLPEKYGVTVQQKFFDKTQGKLCMVITNYSAQKTAKFQIEGFDSKGKVVYRSVYTAVVKEFIVGTYVIYIPKKGVEKIEVKRQ